MKRILIGLLLCSASLAQEPGTPVTKLVELSNVNGRSVDNLIGAFDIQVRLGSDPRFITLHGRKENVEAAEQALKKLDRPKKNIEATFQIMAATKEPNNEKLPADLAPVVKQLRSAFVFQGFRLVETLQLRAREGTGSEASSALRGLDENAPTGSFMVKFLNSSLNSNEKPTVVRLDNLKFGARVPVVTKGGGYNFIETGVNTDIDVREGQTAVVGRANLDGKEGAFFMVVNVKVLD